MKSADTQYGTESRDSDTVSKNEPPDDDVNNSFQAVVTVFWQKFPLDPSLQVMSEVLFLSYRLPALHSVQNYSLGNLLDIREWDDRYARQRSRQRVARVKVFSKPKV